MWPFSPIAHSTHYSARRYCEFLFPVSHYFNATHLDAYSSAYTLYHSSCRHVLPPTSCPPDSPDPMHALPSSTFDSTSHPPFSIFTRTSLYSLRVYLFSSWPRTFCFIILVHVAFSDTIHSSLRYRFHPVS